MLPFFRLGIGGPVAGGRQYLSWVHLDDVVWGLIFCLDEAEAAGAVNLTAPHPVTNADFSRALGHALGRPAALPVPALAIRLLYGDMARIITTGQRVIPRRLENLGFPFRQPELEPALRDVLAKR
jgi:NAD dependent epimerase/dehydratase family enzyme